MTEIRSHSRCVHARRIHTHAGGDCARPSARGRRLPLAAAMALALGLAGCANENIIPFSQTVIPDVPKAAAENFPTFAAPAPSSATTLNATDQAKLQKELEGLARATERRAKEADQE